MEGILQQFIKKFSTNPTLAIEKPLSITPWYFEARESFSYNTSKNKLLTQRMGKRLFNALQKYFDNPFEKQDIFQSYKSLTAARGIKIHTAFTPYSDTQWMQWVYAVDTKLQNGDFQCIVSTDCRMKRGTWMQQTLRRTYKPIRSENGLPYVLSCEIILKESKIVNIHWLVEYQNPEIPHATFETATVLTDVFSSLL